MPETPLLLTPAQVGARLSFGRSKIYELMRSGAIESLKVGRNRRVPADAVDQYVKRLRAEQGA